MKIRWHRDRITGRRWLSLGKLHLGFGPVAFLERIHWGERRVYADYTAYLEGVRRRDMYR